MLKFLGEMVSRVFRGGKKRAKVWLGTKGRGHLEEHFGGGNRGDNYGGGNNARKIKLSCIKTAVNVKRQKWDTINGSSDPPPEETGHKRKNHTGVICR